jgi:muconolactone delta-isomerase
MQLLGDRLEALPFFAYRDINLHHLVSHMSGCETIRTSEDDPNEQ